MRSILMLICASTTVALAQPVAAPPPEVPVEAPPVEAPPVEAPPVEAPPVEPPPPPPPVVVQPPLPPPPPVVASATVTTTSRPRVDDYYSRQRALGIFHRGHLTASVWSGDAPQFTDDMASGMDETHTIASIAFEGAWLGMPSSFGNFHGVEFSTGLRTGPWDFWMSFGTAVTLLNIGHGGPGSMRIGGSFGAGFNFAHGFGYVRGRAALVIIPTRLDVEASWQWTPTSASTSHYDEQQQRISAWYRPGKSKQAYEVYVEVFKRDDDSAMKEREFDGAGVGIGIAR